MLSLAGGVLGVLLASWILSGLTTWVGSRLPIPLLSQVSIDPSVMAFAAIVTILTTIVCGLAPALGATGGSLVAALRDGAPSVSGSRRGRLVRQSFVMAEIALALTVLCGAGLLGRSLMELQSVKPGFTAESALSLRVSLPQRSYADSNAQHAFYTRVIDGLRALAASHLGRRDVVSPARRRWPGHLVLARGCAAAAAERAAGRRCAAGDGGLLHGDGHPDSRRTRRQRGRHAGQGSGRRDQRNVRAADLSGRQPDRPQVHPEPRQRASRTKSSASSAT